VRSSLNALKPRKLGLTAQSPRQTGSAPDSERLSGFQAGSGKSVEDC
jgi:hypothetical protein